MFDLKWLAENKEAVKIAYAKKGLILDIDRLLDLDQKRRQLQTKVDRLRSKRNETSDKIPKANEQERKKLIHDATLVKEALDMAEGQFVKTAHELHDLDIQLHNFPDESVPSKEEGDRIEKEYGEKPKFDFDVQDHVHIGQALDLIDIERAAKVSGARFAYLKNEAALLELALVRWVMDKLARKSFVLMIPPVLVKEEAMFGTGFFPAEPNEYFKMADDNLYLAGTAEVPLVAYHKDETFVESELPKKYAGFSTCFRREAGSYGKDTHGIIRVHQFDKVEMFVYSHPAKAWEYFEELANISEEIFIELELCFRKVTINAGELGAPNAKKYDFEAWIPSQNTYRELASCSNDTDFQARRLNIKYRNKGGQTHYVHTLNNTAIAVGRTIVAILENHQQKDGSVTIPKSLHQYLQFEEIRPKISK